MLPLINRRARIVICGAISQYSGGLDEPELGPRLLHHLLYQRATIQGMLARDYLHRMDEMLRIVGPWVQAGEIVFEETIVDGFEHLPAYAVPLFIRIVPALAHTSTFKNQKVDLRKQGYGEDVTDPIYVLAGREDGYVPFYAEYPAEVKDGKKPR